jgi:hypothetical protein
VNANSAAPQYKRARLVVDHKPRPWTADEFEELDWDLTWSEVEESLGEELRVPQCECLECAKSRFLSQVHEVTKFSDYDDINPKEKEELSDHQYLLLASHVYGFILKDRKYGALICLRAKHPLPACYNIRTDIRYRYCRS